MKLQYKIANIIFLVIGTPFLLLAVIGRIFIWLANGYSELINKVMRRLI